MEGVGQVNIWEHVPLTWKTAIRSMIERGEIDDKFERASRVSTRITYHMTITTGQKVGGIVFVNLRAMADHRSARFHHAAQSAKEVPKMQLRFASNVLAVADVRFLRRVGVQRWKGGREYRQVN